MGLKLKAPKWDQPVRALWSGTNSRPEAYYVTSFWQHRRCLASLAFLTMGGSLGASAALNPKGVRVGWLAALARAGWE